MVHTNAPSHVDLHRLQLDDARALLHHNPVAELPSPEESATGYLQGVINGLCELSLQDPLTGLASRKHLHSIQTRTLDGVIRSGEPALLMMINIQDLQTVAETHGTGAQRELLPVVSKCIAACLRSMDSLARYDTHTFSVVMPSCQPPYGSMMAERIVDAVAALPLELSSGTPVTLHARIGGVFASEWVQTTPSQWTEQALQQLQLACDGGGKPIEIEPIEEIFVSAEEKNLLFSHLGLTESANMDSAPSADTKGGR